MTVTVALAGDTMLGRSVARTLTRTPPEALVAPEVRAALGLSEEKLSFAHVKVLSRAGRLALLAGEDEGRRRAVRSYPRRAARHARHSHAQRAATRRPFG